jgi:membrane protein required for colicin V production
MGNVIIDIMIIIGLVIFVYRGAQKGMVEELLGLTGWLLAILLAIKLGGTAARILVGKVPRMAPLASILGFIIMLIVARAAFHLFAQSFQKMFDADLRGKIDKFVGGLFGFVKGAFSISVLVLAIYVLPLGPRAKDLESRSVLFKHMTKFAQIVMDAVTKFVPQTEAPLRSMVKTFESEKDSAKDKAQGEIEKTQETIQQQAQQQLKDAATNAAKELTPEEAAAIIEKEKKRLEEAKKKLER